MAAGAAQVRAQPPGDERVDPGHDAAPSGWSRTPPPATRRGSAPTRRRWSNAWRRESAAYHCELAWLGGDRAESDVLVTVDGDRIADGRGRCRSRRRPPGSPGSPSPASPTPTATPSTAPCAGARMRGAGSFWTWREQMYAVAAGLDPDSYFRLARATYAEMALAGISTVGEFHYLHHAPGGRRYDSPNAMGDALIAAAAEAGLRITLLDTCYLRGGPGVELDETQRRFSDGDAEAWAARVGELRDGDGRAHRRGRPLGPRRRPAVIAAVARWAAERRVRAARPRVRAAGGERVVHRRARPDADGAARRTAACSTSRSRRSTPCTSPGATSGCSAGTAAGAASARRPSATSPTASPRRRSCARPAPTSPSAATRTP